MKTLLLLLGTAALLGAANAQTNSPAAATNAPALPAILPDLPAFAGIPAGSNAVPRDIEISSDGGSFNLRTGVAVYTGDVHASYSDVKMTCEILTAKISDDRKDRNIVAERNVIIDTLDRQRNPVHATGDKAVYTYKIHDGATNEVIELIGNATMNSQSGSIIAETIIWDLVNDTIRWVKQSTFIHSAGKESSTNRSGTNLVPIRMFP